MQAEEEKGLNGSQRSMQALLVKIHNEGVKSYMM
jgi:hypothetical protein